VPLRDRCREVLVKAWHHLGPPGTIDNLVFYCQVVINCLEEDLQTVDFCREFGRNAPAEMAWLMARILTTKISDKREIDRLAEEITATPQWKRFAERAASPAVMSDYWQRLYAEQTRAAGVGPPVQTKAEETPIALESVIAPSEAAAGAASAAEPAAQDPDLVEVETVETPLTIEPVVPSSPAEQKTSGDSSAKGRLAEIDSFLPNCMAAGYQVNKTHIRLVAGRMNDPKSLEHFQYNIAKCPRPAIRAYENVLKIPVDKFIAKLNRLFEKEGKSSLKKNK
jgi:hypothetical protein